MYVTTIGTKILCDFFFLARTLLSSITLGKRFRTKFTYDYNLCIIIHDLNIISIATRHHGLNLEFLVGCFAVGKLWVERKLYVVLAPMVHDFLYLYTKPNPLFLARWDWADDSSSSQWEFSPLNLSVTKSSSWNLNRLAELCLINDHPSIFYCFKSVHLSHIHRHFIVFEFYNSMIVY